MKLYHYVHCPFCVRVRMGFGLLNIQFESVVTPYDDEATPLSLTGVKMLPIVLDDKGVAQNESLEILKSYDPHSLLSWDELPKHSAELNTLLDKIGSLVHSMAMPYWIWTPEFTLKARIYFQEKKEVKRGPFKDLVKRQLEFSESLNTLLEKELSPHLSPFYKGPKLTVMDIMIAAHLWGMYVVPEFQFSVTIHNFLQSVKEKTHFNYHEDYWT